MAFKDTVIKLMVIGVLFLSILSWVIVTQTDNDPTFLITNNSLINNSYGELLDNLNSAQSQGDLASENFANETPTSALGFVTVTSIVSPVRIFRSLSVGTYNILIKLPAQFLGIPEAIQAVISAIITLLLILGAWFMWKGSNI